MANYITKFDNAGKYLIGTKDYPNVSKIADTGKMVYTATAPSTDNALVYKSLTDFDTVTDYPMNDNGINYGSDSTSDWQAVVYPDSYTGNTLNVKNVPYLHVPKDWASRQTGMGFDFSSCDKLIIIDTSDWDVSKVTNMNYMFNHCSNLTSLDVSSWNVSNVTDMSNMFNGCSNLTSLDVSSWNVSNVTDMSNMFNGCSNLTTLDVSGWDVSKVSNMSYMFYNCSKLTTLDVSSWNVSNVTNINHMFAYCSSLTTLDLSSWDISKMTDMSYMFYGCFHLQTVYVRADMLDKWKKARTYIGSTDYFKVKA